MTIASRVGTLVTTAILAFGIAMPAKADLIKELIPTGKLRVAIAVAPAPSALYAVKDSTAGKFRGVTVDLGAALARKLGVPVEFLPHLASGEIQNSAASGKWDVTFMPVDEERARNSSTSAMPTTFCKVHISWRPVQSAQKSRTRT